MVTASAAVPTMISGIAARRIVTLGIIVRGTLDT
jgi:hypothetical protein